jgi:DNA repair exonuclease SbcCD ATPase subunit
LLLAEMIREEFLELLRTDAAFREEVRRQLLTESLLALPERFDQLTKAVDELAITVRELAEAQRRTDERLAEFQRRTDERFAELAEAQRRTDERLAEFQRRTDERFAELAEAQRRTDERLAEFQRRTDERFAELAEAQRRTDERFAELAEAQRRTDERFAELAEAQRRTEAEIAKLAEAQQRTEATMREMQLVLQELATWQRSEAGRREGERYERDVIRRAPVLFNGGQGGPPDQPQVQQRLTKILRPLLEELETKREADPFLADLIWWKGETVIVAEVSNRVNGYDVIRAANRAETLRRAGAQAVPVVIGADWANDESSYEAKMRKVEWKTESDVSEGFLEIRRLPANGEVA